MHIVANLQLVMLGEAAFHEHLALVCRAQVAALEDEHIVHSGATNVGYADEAADDLLVLDDRHLEFHFPGDARLDAGDAGDLRDGLSDRVRSLPEHDLEIGEVEHVIVELVGGADVLVRHPGALVEADAQRDDEGHSGKLPPGLIDVADQFEVE